MRNFNEDYSLVRFLHAIPNGDTVDLQLNGNPFFNDLDFTEFTPYMYVPKGEYTVEVFGENTIDNPIVSESIVIGDDELLTIAIVIDNGVLRLLPIEEDKEIASGRTSKVRFVHLVPNGREVNILLNEDMEFSNVGYLDVAEYILVDPGKYDVIVEASINNETINRSQININPNRIYTFYALGEAPNFEVLQSLDGATFLI